MLHRSGTPRLRQRENSNILHIGKPAGGFADRVEATVVPQTENVAGALQHRAAHPWIDGLFAPQKRLPEVPGLPIHDTQTLGIIGPAPGRRLAFEEPVDKSQDPGAPGWDDGDVPEVEKDIAAQTLDPLTGDIDERN
jgi:hypothetical protein